MLVPLVIALVKLVAQMVSRLVQLVNIWVALVMPLRFSKPMISVQLENALNQQAQLVMPTDAIELSM